MYLIYTSYDVIYYDTQRKNQEKRDLRNFKFAQTKHLLEFTLKIMMTDFEEFSNIKIYNFILELEVRIIRI